MAWGGEGRGRAAAAGGGGRSAAAGGGSEALESAAQALQQSPERGRRRRRGRGTTRPTPARGLASAAALGGESSPGEVGRGRLRGASLTEPGRGAAAARVSAAAAGVPGAAAAAATPETARSAARGVGGGGGASGRRGAEDRAAGGGSECGGGWARRGGSVPGGSRPSRRRRVSRELSGPGRRGRQVVRLAPGSPAGPCPSQVEGRPPCVPRAGRPGLGPAAPSGASRRAPPGPAARRVLGGAGSSSSPLAGASLLGARGIPGQEKPVGKGTAPWPPRSPRPGRRSSSLPSRGPGSSDPRPQPSLSPEPEPGLAVRASWEAAALLLRLPSSRDCCFRKGVPGNTLRILPLSQSSFQIVIQLVFSLKEQRNLLCLRGEQAGSR